jgi:excisionase family DNA binding protein
MMTKRLCGVPEVAEMVSVSEKFIWKMIAGRQLELLRIGRLVRINKETVDRLIEHGTIPALPPRQDVRGNRRGSPESEPTSSRKIEPRGTRMASPFSKSSFTLSSESSVS